jgi:hypothetical protein
VWGAGDVATKNKWNSPCDDGEMALPCHCWRLWCAWFVESDFWKLAAMWHPKLHSDEFMY